MTSGFIFDTRVCIGDSCKIMPVYDVYRITEDYLMYNQKGGFGVIGMGPLSPVWEALVDPATNSSTYSIALARI
jgi:hypothetical protein